MFNCTIAMTDNYFRYGLFILLNETLTRYPSEPVARLTDTLNERTRVVIIDAESVSFNLLFTQACRLKQNTLLTIFIVSSSKSAFLPRLPRGTPPHTVADIVYKTDGKTEIKHKIRRALKPRGLQHRDVAPSRPVKARSLPEKGAPKPEVTARYAAILTPREVAIIELFKQGLTGKDIAQRLGRSEKTISGQKRSAMKKLGVRTNMALFHQIH
ncbi:LuxR C-terminal-related transcriptional regulator [Yersinia intermedia]|uniref:LuxR C-terminal-related transcriptional regulator n=2 Tax=Yersinia intermedia TaxID=631 RepID=UPI0022FE930C|nr:LuxR C-terminal-related transcriptional regulator [Yersinia intermedia]MDA5519045.1 LuxR C-terminal-related transcriptional regulator [Yersinia intermedia]